MNRILPFIFILLAIGLFFGYVRPAWNGQIAQDKQDIASYDSALDAANRFTAKEAQLQQQRDQIPADEQNRLLAFLPDGVDNVQLIVDLNALANRSGMVLSNFSTSDSVNAPTADSASTNTDGSFSSASTVDSLTLSVSATGTYDAFRSFLAGIEQSLRPLDVIALTVSDSDTGVYTYQMTFKFYWLH